MEDFGVYLGLGGLAVVAALIEVVKKAAKLKDTVWDRFLGLIAIVIGIVVNAFIAFTIVGMPRDKWGVVVVMGVIVGLAASGAYNTQKAVRNL
jgi:hypothetical protein